MPIKILNLISSVVRVNKETSIEYFVIKNSSASFSKYFAKYFPFSNKFL